MENESISDLQARLAIATRSLQLSEERATAGQLALELMHEIRNPLEALTNLNYLAFVNADTPATVREYLEDAREQISTLNGIAGRTLGFARASPAVQAIDMVEIAEAALRIHQRAIEAKKVRLVRLLPQELQVEVHTGQILQVISNIIVNAIDALPSEGTLSLRLRQKEGKIHLMIADNGHGIPQEHIAHIFQPFFSTKGESGTGLGLALSKKIIDSHQGTIKVRSSIRPGRTGTIFKICLPATAVAAA